MTQDMPSSSNMEEDFDSGNPNNVDCSVPQQMGSSESIDGVIQQPPKRDSQSTHLSSKSRRSSDLRGSSVSNFFRSMIGRRKHDYHSDVAHQTQGHVRNRHQQTTNAVNDSMVESNNPASIDASTLPPWRRFFVSKHRRAVFHSILESVAWKASLIFNSLILIFGAEIRILFLPPAADNYVNSVFCLVLAFFASDMCMRCDTEDRYINRFLFWCDFLSTITLIFDISWIPLPQFSEKHFEIILNSYGIPVSGMDKVNEARPFELSPLLLTIFQAARVARFVRSSRAVKISNKVNWHFLFNLFNPMWWFQHCTHDRRLQRRPSEAPDNNSKPLSPSRLSGHSIGSVSTPSPPRSTNNWSWLGMGVLAAVKANASMEKKVGLGRRLRLFSRSPFDTEDFRRQFAATRIQRAWRAVLRQRELGPDDNFTSSEFLGSADVAWKGRLAASNPVERELEKRSLTVRTQRSVGQGSSQKHTSMDKKLDRADKKAGMIQAHLQAPLDANNDANKRRNESQVGSAMRELTGQRVAIGIIVALLLTVAFTYTEADATRPTTMIVLHNQTGNNAFANRSLTAARSSSIPDLFFYQLANGENRTYDVVEHGVSPDDLRPEERLRISINDPMNRTTTGVFSLRNERGAEAIVSILSTLFIILVWFCGVTAFAGPVMILVVIPIERMVRLLAMLMVDPLGYQSTSRYKRFVDEEDEITKSTRWTKEILKGMETSFLMSTILRIGSLMKVGFGSAGVEIIRKNLEKGQSKNMLVLSSQGSTVSCIFLFCDIRNFTDATECLQEEVFVFTNRIAAVVHSNCHAYGGSANKNVGDAFLLSWLLDEDNSSGQPDGDSFSGHKTGEGFTAKNNQADKALLSVVKICMALHYDDYYIEAMTDAARQALVNKLKNRKGPIVQMGFGMHAGRAVQGAIGSQRKIDATYVSEAVERAESLESSTKQYGLKMLMSDSFHRLLHPSNRRRCRKVDQILIRDDDDDDGQDDFLDGDIMELFTFDLDIDALWRESKFKSDGRESDTTSDAGSRRGAMGKIPRGRRMSLRMGIPGIKDDSDEISQSGFMGPTSQNFGCDGDDRGTPKLVLPTGPALYNSNVWTSVEMRVMRELYSDGLFFQKFMSGLHSFYAKDWDNASQSFSVILQRFEDGPSRYFMNQIEKHGGKPPRDFLGYGIA